MATVQLVLKNNHQVVIEEIINFAAVGQNVPYWMVETAGHRQFFAFDIVGQVNVTGEEELIEANKKRQAEAQSAKDLARATDLGLE